MDLTDFWRAVRRFWALCFITFAATTALGYALATSGDPEFSATATIAVSPNPAGDGSVQIVDFEIPKIVEVLDSRDFAEEVRDAVPAGSSEAAISISAEREEGAGIISVTATGPDAEAAADWANAAATAIVERYEPTDDDPETPATTADLVTVELVESAVPPGGTGLVNTFPIMLASVVLGLILAGVVAAVAYKSSAAFDLAEQIRNELRVPVLGEIPSTRELRGANADIGSLLSADLPTLVEAFQSLRINTEVQLAKGSKVLSITSWERGEGKSTVTAALGIMLAAVGHDVVLIDTDLRAPSLHERLQEPFGEGLAEFDELGLIMTLRETKYPNLSFIPAGLPDRHPAQIIAVALHQAIEAVRRQRPNSIILLDTPSLGPVNEGGRKTPRVVAETSTVVRTADEVLLVVSATTNKLFDIAGGVDRLREDGVSVAGAVINRYRKRGWWPF